MTKRNEAWQARSPLLGVYFTGVVLLAGVAAAFWPSSIPARFNLDKFPELWPDAAELPGWTVSPQAVAATPEMKRAVAELLNYDAGAFVVYSSGDLRISIFAVYWLPRKMSQRLVASHTPDICWVANGWQLQERSTFRYNLRESFELPMEQRVFRSGIGTEEHVIFCHLVNRRPISLAGRDGAAWHGLFTDLVQHGFQLRREQLFLRISSNRPLPEFAKAKPVISFMTNLVNSGFGPTPDV